MYCSYVQEQSQCACVHALRKSDHQASLETSKKIKTKKMIIQSGLTGYSDLKASDLIPAGSTKHHKICFK